MSNNDQPQNTATNQAALPSNADSAAAKSGTSAKAGGLTALLADLVMCAVISAAVAAAIVHFAPRLGLQEATKPQQFAVINADALVQEHVRAMGDQVRAGELSSEQMVDKTREFTKALGTTMEAYANEGVIVLNSRAVAMVPADMQDLTAAVRESLQKGGELVEHGSKK